MSAPRFLALASLALALALAAPLAAQAVAAPEPLMLEPLVVTATRSPRHAATLPLTVEVIGPEALRRTPALTLDEALRQSPAFSLFRRSGSLTANPTAQSVSLRGLGPSGASRALVLLDGVPVNDPFGGWIAWTKLPAASLARAEIVRGGGSSAWGGSSLGGVIHLLSAPLLPASASPESVTHWVTQPGSLRATLGDFRTRGAEAQATLVAPSGRDAFRLDAASLATDGVHLVRAPGLIDRPADLETYRGQLTWAHRIHEAVTLTTAVRAWREERGNGTPYQQNASEELFASAALTGTPAGDAAVSSWTLAAYAQDQDYRSTFSAVNASRTDERPAADQYAVPARAAGFSAQVTRGDSADPEAVLTTLGLDVRYVSGETREFFFYDAAAAADFLRERRAGGTQTVAGLFATHTRPLLGPDLTLTLGARLDSTWRRDGFRRETLRATGASVLDQAYADRDDLAFSPSAGLAWRASEMLTVRAAAYSAYRTPTLNELYRPFRIGAVTTNANPDLEPETLLGGEFGLAWASPEARRGLRATVFENALSDAVANITLDATTRQRRNLASTRVRGFELGGHFTPAAFPAIRLEADYLLSDARVRSAGAAAAAPELDGKRLAQVPRHTLAAGAAWQASPALALELRARWFSEQYEDDQNTLALASATRLDLAAHYAFTPRLRLTLAVENLLDAEIETARSAAGLVSIAPPRWARAEITYTW